MKDSLGVRQITSLIRENNCSKTRGVSPLSLPIESPESAERGPHMVYVFPLPVCPRWSCENESLVNMFPTVSYKKK
jgi:hypothetical protein